MDFDPVTELQRCLALVRPVGMSDEAAEQWLFAAVAEVIDVSGPTLARACSEVRKTATHHGQIIPGILGSEAVKDAKRWQATARRMALDGHPIEGVTALPPRGSVQRIGQVKLLGNGE